jgi:hypothetical protein
VIGQTLDLELVGSTFRDDEPAYWAIQRENLVRQFDAKVRGRIERQEIRHLSVFALAPQPLLIELGRLLCDIVPATIHQRHREPATWRWQPDQPAVRFTVSEPTQFSGAAALKLSVSATINDDRIHKVVGAEASIWSICAEAPHNDILRRPEDQSTFRALLRRLYDRIKACHGDGALVHVFPALPASLAIEIGRVWMPKSDVPLRLYDNNRHHGFVSAFDVS